MMKLVTERPKFYRKTVTHWVMFCDGCGKRIVWFTYSADGKHYCEKCLQKQREKTKNVSSVN